MSVIAIIMSAVCAVVVLGSSSPDIDELGMKILKVSSITFLVAIGLLIILPSKDTMLTMLALYYVTPDNIQMVQGNIVDFVGQITQAVKEVR